MATFDVSIIGAGPTGLFAAFLARRLGLSVHIQDKRTGPLEVGRADALNARTQQVLDIAGILKELRPVGLKCNTSSVFRRGKFASRENSWWTSLENTKYRDFLMIGQSYVECALLKHLDIDVHYNTQVDYVNEKADYAETGSGENLVRSKFVIAADGAHSFVRKELGIAFEGEAPNMVWAVLDTFLDTDFPVCDEIISFENNGQSRVAWIPREFGMARFYILLDGEITEEASQECIREHMAPYRVDFTRTEWFSAYNVQERVAETFLSPEHQRICLAGDAAHVHAVNGGQGLNTGISDAFALVWRISLACKGFDRRILETYDEERRPVAQGVVTVAGKLVRSTLRTAKEYVELVEKNAVNITGMGIVYPPSAAIFPGSFGKFIAGARCPDVEFTRSIIVRVRLYELFNVAKFVVLKPSNMKYGLTDKVAQQVEIWNVDKKDESFEVTTEKGLKLVTNFSLPAGDGPAIVIRPDLYVGYVGADQRGYFGFLV